MNQRRRLVSLPCHGGVVLGPGTNQTLQVTAGPPVPGRKELSLKEGVDRIPVPARGVNGCEGSGC